MKSQTDEHYTCPLSAVDRRLEDTHRHWHEAENAYFDPDAFRVAIQTAIQTLRTVTFILQSNKALIPHFDAWYAPWQEKMRNDPLMRWMVDARNKIEKRGDLEAHSFVRAEIVASYLDEGPRIEVPAQLFDAPLKLVKSIPASASGDHIRKDGSVRIQRRWVENTLPEHELLDAVALAYGRVAEVVRDAHVRLELKPPATTDMTTGEVYGEGLRGGRLPCMIGHADLRSLNVWLANGRPVEVAMISQNIDLSKADMLFERYQTTPEEIFGKGENPEETLQNLFATARKMFAKDGYHVTVVFLLKGTKPVRIMRMIPEEHGEKYLIMRALANEVVKIGADAIILLGEIWKAPFNRDKPYQRAVNSPDRSEALAGTLVSKAGEPVEIYAEITRDDRRAKLGPNNMARGGATFIFAPIYEAWGRSVPGVWLKMSRGGHADKA
jgi:hypothetical protein